MAPAAKSPYAGYRFPAEVISQAVWLYFRFPLRWSLRTFDPVPDGSAQASSLEHPAHPLRNHSARPLGPPARGRPGLAPSFASQATNASAPAPAPEGTPTT
jgi:hypothetical protein